MRPPPRRSDHDADLVFALSRAPSPLGPVLIVTDEDGRLRALDWESHAERLHRLLARQYRNARVRLDEAAAPSAITDALAAYFGGALAALDAVPVETAGTAFQREVWAALRRIPAGATWSYGQLAAHLGRPAAVRAVGLANGANPINMVVPCHRVIGAGGALTGYGGGLERKRWLLAHEASAVRSAG